MKVLIATPVYDDTVTTGYMLSVQKLIAALSGQVIFINLFIGSSLVTRARNAYASILLEDPSFTHMLFVDSDMGFRPEAVQRMIDFDKDVVGCIYPRRSLDFDRFHSVSRQVADPLTARMIAQDYVAKDDLVRTDFGDGKWGFVTERGFVRTKGIGAGVTLIKRGVFERLRAAYPELASPPDESYRNLAVKREVFQCFEPAPGEDGLFVSEDLAFCQRWRDRCGGEIWACVDETISHVGRVAFSGRYIDRMRHPDIR